MKIAILIPCYNEELTIDKVIRDFRKEFPEAEIYVYDNNSTDKTFEIANKSGAIVKKEYRQGKGNVVRSMFREVDADIYILVDADDTYFSNDIHKLIEPILQDKADMVVGDRHSSGDYRRENKRAFHNLGNNIVKSLVNTLFSSNLNDIMSGYRVFNKRFVKSIPILSREFEIETEMTLHALDKNWRITEIPIRYKDRPEGSYSKLHTFSDGAKVFKTILWLFKDYKPLPFFIIISFIFFIFSLLAGLPVIYEFIQSSYISKIPSAILAVGLMLISILSLFSAFILDTLVKQNKKEYELYLNLVNENE